MALKEWFLERGYFCCCLPVRFGVFLMSILTFVLAGALSFLFWFEVSATHDPPLPHGTHISLILAGVVETLLAFTSILGFIGAVVRKQSFLQLYAYFMYLHFLINLGVGSFFLWTITHTIGVDAISLCPVSAEEGTAQDPCHKLLNSGKGILIGGIVLIWLVELYGSLIITRYVHQVRVQKRISRALFLRRNIDAGFMMSWHVQYESGVSEAHVGLLESQTMHSTPEPTNPVISVSDAEETGGVYHDMTTSSGSLPRVPSPSIFSPPTPAPSYSEDESSRQSDAHDHLPPAYEFVPQRPVGPEKYTA